MQEKETNSFEDIKETIEEVDKPFEVVYDTTKDFYKGMRGELRFKAEGLFKKAREKGISIEDIEIKTLKSQNVEFPGVGNVELPTYIVKVKGIILENQQSMIDGKQIDFYNRYQKYIAAKIEDKNQERDERGKIIYNNRKPVVREEPDLTLSDWEKFEIGKAIIEDKEFGLEKTITGACDRVIRKLMGENDWLYPGEARLLEEEFDEVDRKVSARGTGKGEETGVKKASEKQLAYLKSKIKHAGLDPEDRKTLLMIVQQLGFGEKEPEQLSVPEMSRLIDTVNNAIPAVKEKLKH